MKSFKRILTMLICVSLVLSSFATVSVFAEDGKGTITITGQSGSDITVAGKTFNIYRIFDATTDGTNTSYSWNMDTTDINGNSVYYNFFFGGSGVIGEKTDGKIQEVVDYVISLKENALELSQFATSMYSYIKTQRISPNATKTAGTSDTTVVFEDQAFGYYLIYDGTDLTGDTDGVRSAVMLNNVNKDVTVYLKADRPNVVKQVLGNDGVYAKGTSSTIGDVVTFKISTVVPDHTLYESYTYKLEDTMANGLKLDVNTIEVYHETKLTLGTDYTLDTTGTNGTDFIITFTDIKDFDVDDEITVTYKAHVTKDIAPQTYNRNTVKLVYSNDPGFNTTSEVSDHADVYSYRFVFSKFAQDTNGVITTTRLSGAEFQLNRNVNGSYEKVWFLESTQTNDHGDYTLYTVVPAGTDGAVDTLVVHDKGEAQITLTQLNYGGHLGDVSIFGLGEGEYELIETVAPAGYNLPDAAFYFTLTDTIGPTTGIPTSLTITGSHSGDAKIANTTAMVDSVLTAWADITNVPGSALPETGGMGTTLFTVGGIVLMAAAVAFFTLRKRSSVAA